MTSDIDQFLLQNSPFQTPDFIPEKESKQIIQEQLHILIVGAGGLGCEILKNLVLMGFKQLSIVDMDTIELTNLNRQFLFRKSDIGKYKSITAAEKIKNLYPEVNITAYTQSIQDLLKQCPTFFNTFLCIISGLDNVEARLFLNKVVHELYEKGIIIPLVDGGTEGPLGQTRVINPFQTPCYACILTQTPIIQNNIPLCTLQGRPRIEEHLILTIKEKTDLQGEDFVTQVKKLGNQLGIDCIMTWPQMEGVIRQIIPALASCNSIIAGIVCNEVFKLMSGCRPIGIFQWYGGQKGVYMHRWGVGRLETCTVCGQKP